MADMPIIDKLVVG